MERNRSLNVPSMAKKRLNRFPFRRDEFDQCMSFVKDKVYFCVKIDGVWFAAEMTRLGEL